MTNIYVYTCMCACCINYKIVASNYFAIVFVLLYVLFMIILPMICRFKVLWHYNVSLHLLFLALRFTSLIYKMVDNCVDTVAIKTYVTTPLKNKKSKIHLPKSPVPRSILYYTFLIVYILIST